MRYLTLQRTKSAIDFFVTIKVYIEDPASNEIKIQGVPCRKIGELKNGEQQSFIIGDEKLRIYIMSMKIDKNLCPDFYEVPAGTENVFLTCKFIWHPILTDVCRFEGVPTEEMKYHRKQNLKKSFWIVPLALIIYAVIMTSIWNFSFNTPQPKIFTHYGLSITLNEDFVTEDKNEVYAVYTSNEISVTSAHIPLGYFADYSVAEFSDRHIETNRLDTVTQQKDGLTFYEYEVTYSKNNQWHHTTFFYKTDDYFYIVLFSIRKDLYDDYKDDIFEYAKSVTFQKTSQPYI